MQHISSKPDIVQDYKVVKCYTRLTCLLQQWKQVRGQVYILKTHNKEEDEEKKLMNS